MTERKFEWTLKDGRQAELRARYGCAMKKKVIDADGIPVVLKAEPSDDVSNNLEFYIEGKKMDSCWNSAFWELSNAKQDGKVYRKVWGLDMVFVDPEVAAKYEEWIAGVIDDGTSEEVKAYRAEQKRKEDAKAAEKAREIIRRAEAQKDIPTTEEALRRLKVWNDVLNEGGEGYLPKIYTLEDYQAAKAKLKRLGLEE